MSAGQVEEIGTVDYTTTDCACTDGFVICTHPATEIDADGDLICRDCDEFMDGPQQPQQTLCPCQR